MPVSKKKVIKSLESLSEELRELMKKQYPTGYENSITRISNAKKEPIFVFPLETDEATYLVKIPATKNSEGEYDVESKPKDGEFETGPPQPPREEDEFATGDDFEGEDFNNDEGEGEENTSKDPSYEPDFDN